jgi:hypothetical protein
MHNKHILVASVNNKLKADLHTTSVALSLAPHL